MVASGMYHRPITIQHAARLMKQASLFAMTEGFLSRANAQTIIDMQSIPELRRIRIHDEALEFGAALTVGEMLDQDSLLPVLHRSLTRALPRRLRPYLTIEETLHAREHPFLREWLAALLALNAAVEHHTFEADEPRWVDLESLRYSGALDETLLTGLFIPALRPNQQLETAYLAPALHEPADVCAAVLLSWNEDSTVETARVVVCGVFAPSAIVVTPHWLSGERLYRRSLARLIEQVNDQLQADVYRSCMVLDQRRVMVSQCVVRALLSCCYV